MAARALTVRQMAKVVKQRDKEPTDPPDLGPDEMRLYSYYKPGLVAGNYTISAKQTIVSPSNWGQQTMEVTNVAQDTGKEIGQSFEVVLPRFSLDPNIINSYYPPDGHQDEGRVLPHIVLNDPHYPWEIHAGVTARMNQKIDPQNTRDDKGVSQVIYRNLVPWVALLVFDPEELRHSSLAECTALKLPGFAQDDDLLKQNGNGTFSMTVHDYLTTIPEHNRVNYQAGYANNPAGFQKLQADTSKVNVIFPTKQQFKDLFASTDSTTPPNPLAQLEAYKYLAHVRHINTIGFPDAGVEEEGLFSIVMSSRLGKFDMDQPHTQVCHLVSIENVDSTIGSWVDYPTTSNRIGMVSLHSWIYTALPPNPVNFIDTVRNLVENQQMLTIPKSSSQLPANPNPATAIMLERTTAGYTLARWRPQSGEETVAFSRGPLVPCPVPFPPSPDIVDCSNTSQEYQILDPKTGFMDLSYSSAWQLGKTMAISDTVFSGALMRFRSLVRNSSVQQTQISVNSMVSAGQSLAELPNIFDTTKSIANGNTGTPFSRLVGAGSDRAIAASLTDSSVRAMLVDKSKANVVVNASAGSGTGQEIYNEFNLAKGSNSDWAVILSWLCEKLSLGGIPSQYLIPEPAFLPPESLRFFHINDFWLDCFIDGALSVANHLETDDDETRRQIKVVFNQYLGTPVSRAGYKPQIPSYGFAIRSNLIKVMPDMRITVAWKPNKNGAQVADDRAPVCRWTKWDDQTLFCLLDRQPEELDSIILAQPPHQQRFSLGSYVKKAKPGVQGDQNLVEFDLRCLYTSANPPVDWPQKAMPNPAEPTTWLNFDTRVMYISKMANGIHKALQFLDPSTGQAYEDMTANSCELGLELNDPSYYFKIVPPAANNFQPTPATQRNRQLYINRAAAIPPPPSSTAPAPAPLPPPPNMPSPPAKPIAPTPTPSTPSTNPPPTRKPMFTITRLNPTVTPASLLNSLVGRIAFQGSTKIYADFKKPPTRYTEPVNQFDDGDWLPTRNKYFYDLIFSIRRTTSRSHLNPFKDLELMRLDIDIPMDGGLNGLPPGEEPLLDAQYYGPGVRMLSNQRFVPFLFFNKATTTTSRDFDGSTKTVVNNANMHIELVPRSADDDYGIKLDDGKTMEIGFRLGEAPICQGAIMYPGSVLVKKAPPPQDSSGKGALLGELSIAVESALTPPTKLDRVGKVEIKITEWYRNPKFRGLNGKGQPPEGEPITWTYVLLKRDVAEEP